MYIVYIYKYNCCHVLNKYEDIICIKMNQNYNFIILLIKYILLFNMLKTKIYLDQYLCQYYTS
jgi:hypothetical protein